MLSRNPKTKVVRINPLYTNILHTLELHVPISIAFFVIIILFSRSITYSVHSAVQEITLRFSLNTMASAELRELASSITSSVRLDLWLFFLVAHGMVALLQLTTDVILSIIKFLLSRIFHDKALLFSHNLELELSKDIFPVLIGSGFLVVIGGVIVIVALGSTGLLSLSFISYFAVASAIIICTVGLIWYVRKLQVLCEPGSPRRKEVLALIGARHNRIKTWLSLTILILWCFIFAHWWVPWTIYRLGTLPGKIDQHLTSIEKPERLLVLKALAEEHLYASNRSDSEKKAEKQRLMELYSDISNFRQTFVADLVKMVEGIPKEQVELIVQNLMQLLAMIFAISFVAETLLPTIIAKANKRRLIVLVAYSVFPLPVLFVLDRMGVTSSFPWLWAIVNGPLALADDLLVTRPLAYRQVIYWVRQGKCVHLNLKCPALKFVNKNRLLKGEALTLIRHGFRKCRRCFPINE